MIALSGRHLLAALISTNLGLAVSACSTSTIGQIVSEPPPPTANVLFVGKVDTAKPEWRRAVLLFRNELANHLKASDTFAYASARIPSDMPDNALVLTGHFSEIDRGSEVARLLVGYGAGSPTIEGHFKVSDATGRILLSFEQWGGSFAGTGSAAHWTPIDMDEEMANFAEETALYVADWRHAGAR